MRVISGTLKSIPLQWLPALANIKPPHIRRKDALVKTIKKSVDYKRSLLYQMMLVQSWRLTVIGRHEKDR